MALLASTFGRKLRTASLLSAAALAAAASAPARAHAQALDTAGRKAAIYVFGGASFEQPDYGPDGYKNWGYTLGGDYDRYFRFKQYPVGAGFEVRYAKTTGQIVDESYLGGGLRLNTVVYKRFHPFVNFLFGVGTIDFNYVVDPTTPDYRSDRGRAFQYGFGLDIDVYRNWALKLDGQQESWNMGPNVRATRTNGIFTLGPAIYTAAIVYRIPFRSYIGATERSRRDHSATEDSYYSKSTESQGFHTTPPQPPAPATTTTTTTDTTTTTTTPPTTDSTAPAPATAQPQPADTATPPPADTTTPPPATTTTPPQTGTSNPPPQQ